MNRLRTKWRMRVAAALLLASLLPVTFATAAHATRHTATYADWVRLQLRIPADDVVALALETAAESRAGSLEAFLATFVEAYEAQHPEQPLASAFAAEGLSNEALISYLKGRYLGFAGEAVPPRASFTTATVAAQQVLNRGMAAVALPTRHDLSRRIFAVSLQPTPAPAFVVLLRTRCAAQPLGP